jgi:RNA polymerase sigma-70 factor (ECF subfamily)
MPEPAVAPDLLDDRRLSPELVRALEALPDTQRQAVELIHVEGLTVAEAASWAGVSISALKVRAHRGYRALRALLGGEPP